MFSNILISVGVARVVFMLIYLVVRSRYRR